MWKPDGTQFVFSMRGTGTEQIYILSLSCANIAACRVVRLAPDELAMQPAWSPDGSKVAFSVGHNKAYGQAIYVINADGSGERKLTQLDSHENNLDFNPAWSPDGNYIA